MVSYYILVSYFGGLLSGCSEDGGTCPSKSQSSTSARLCEIYSAQGKRIHSLDTKKGNTGFGDSTDSEFAEYLLSRRYSRR